MAFNDREISNQDGKPIALYEFHYGNSYWRYCTSDKNEIVGEDGNGNPLVWAALAITEAAWPTLMASWMPRINSLAKARESAVTRSLWMEK